ncbi:hypothetical protein GQR58_029121 [Nymphon striatum]|nr:hypothetical protein GQR58_029121 [Nymphon striatum]
MVSPVTWCPLSAALSAKPPQPQPISNVGRHLVPLALSARNPHHIGKAFLMSPRRECVVTPAICSGLWIIRLADPSGVKSAPRWQSHLRESRAVYKRQRTTSCFVPASNPEIPPPIIATRCERMGWSSKDIITLWLRLGETKQVKQPSSQASPQTVWMLAVRNDRDRAAFGQLFDYFAPRLKGFIMRSGMGSGQAEEVVQEVMLTVWRKSEQFDPSRAQVSAWIYQIARNRQIDVIRKENHLEMTSILRTTAAALSLCIAAGSANAANIVEIAAGDDRFSTLVTAVTTAGLAETLSGPGPFTVYAPLNDAFAALPEGTVETLLKPENVGQLTDVLLYHVDDRQLTASMIPAGSNYFKPVLASERLCITAGSEGVKIADGTGEMATVVVADIMADNGVIHVIDKVLLPGTRPACH